MGSSANIKLRVLPGEFGAIEVAGFDPTVHLAERAVAATIRNALCTHAVVCVRLASPLSDDDAAGLATMIGTIKDPIGRTRDGGEMRYSEARQIIDAGFVLTDELRAELGGLEFGGDSLRPGLFETFHTDDTYTERPAAATVLHAWELPSGPGGDTTFMDMRAAYRLLGADRQEQLRGRRVHHAYNNHGAFPPRVAATGEYEQLVDVHHPLVRAHPVTGEPTLYLDLDRAIAVDGMPDHEGRDLLQSLQDHAEAHAPRYSHRWQPHDVVIWDNVAVQHRAAGDFPVGEPRNFWRFMIEGPEPELYARGG